jgi:glycosyltransferase involved in cell wall biosynthesis
VIVTDRCGIAGFFEDGEALVVPYERAAVVEAVRRVLTDADLRNELSRGGPVAARRTSWDRVAARQEEIYEAVAARKASTDAS